MKRTLNRGFTLIELLTVVTIITILAGFGFASYGNSQKRARDGKRKADLEQIRSALEMCRADTGSYPLTGGFSFGGSLSCGGQTYMNSVPVDPKNVNPYIYVYASDGGFYALCVSRLEAEGNLYCVYNP